MPKLKDEHPVYPYSEEEDELAYKAWLQGMYQANCEERALYNEIPYKTIKEYEKANSEFLTQQWNQGFEIS